MTKPEPKPKWYSARMRILDYSTRGLIIAACIMAVFITGLLILKAKYAGNSGAPQIPSPNALIGMFGACCFAILYRKIKHLPEPGAVDRRSQVRQFLLSIVIIAPILCLWVYLLNEGVAVSTISMGFGIVGGVILVLAIFTAGFLHLRDKKKR